MFFMCILQCRRNTVANIDWRDYEDLEEQAFEKMSTPTSKKKKSWKQILKKDMSYCVCTGPNKTKGFTCKAHCRSKELKKAPRIPRKKGQRANSKKHSDLYTDENPKGTIHGLGFKDVKTAKTSVSKIKRSGRSHAHKTQAAIAMEQRAREMGKTSEAAVYRRFIEQQKKKTQERKK